MNSEHAIHSFKGGHNGCCKTCVGFIEKIADDLKAHIVNEDKLLLSIQLQQAGIKARMGVLLGTAIPASAAIIVAIVLHFFGK